MVLIYLLIESILEFLLNVFLITKVLFIDLVDWNVFFHFMLFKYAMLF
jgi:hypothetical protein